MEIVDLKSNIKYLNEYVKLCTLEWGSAETKEEFDLYTENKIKKILEGDKVISVLGLVDEEVLIGFISLFKYDGNERNDLTPWYATMYVKKNYRSKGYSKMLNDSIIKEASTLGYKRLYLKTDLVNYYEKFGAIYIENLKCGEKLYYMDCINKLK